MQTRKIAIQDKASRLRKAFRRKDPEIGGGNFFTGEYDSGSGWFSMTTNTPSDWESFWTQTLKLPPPGNLPSGAKAVMIAAHYKNDPVELEPEAVTRDGKNLDILWKRIHTATPDSAPGKSRYAVLLLPAGEETQHFKDVFLAEEQRAVAAEIRAREEEKRRKLFEEIESTIRGIAAPIMVKPPLRLRKARLDP